MRQREKIRRIVAALSPYSPQKVILFGSQARGRPARHSDVDIIVVKETSKRFVDRLMEVSRFLDLPFGIDVFVYTPDELEQMLAQGNPFITMALGQGVVIYERPRGRSQAVAKTGRG